MEEYSLTLGAHLLLWVFPLALVVGEAPEGPVAPGLVDGRVRGGGRDHGDVELHRHHLEHVGAAAVYAPDNR